MSHHKKTSTKKVLRGIGNAFKSVAHPVEHMVKGATDLPGKALDRAGDLTEEFALPALIIGGIVLFVYLNSQK